MLQRGAPKLGKDGKPMKDKHGKVIYEPYRIKVLNTINFRKSMHYNPFAYIHSEKDILKLVTTLIANTKGEGKAGDDFWVKAETLPLNEGRTYGQPEVVLISLPQVATGLRLRLPGSFRRRGFQPDLLMPQGALLRRGRSDSFTSAKPEEDAVGNQCRIRQKGGIVSWRYFTLQ